ncbi:5195_t:CDS:2, partial [Scutellospora calospora]
MAQRNKNKSTSEKIQSFQNELTERSQNYLLNLEEQSTSSTYSTLNNQESIQDLLKEIAKAFQDTAIKVLERFGEQEVILKKFNQYNKMSKRWLEE